jgi:hypothetical protein
MIKKVKGGYQVVSRKGKNLGGPYTSLALAKKRLRQMEFFKHRKDYSRAELGPKARGRRGKN